MGQAVPTWIVRWKMIDVSNRVACPPAAVRRVTDVLLILLPLSAWTLSAWMLSFAMAAPAQAEDLGLGASVRHNIMAQTVDPDPVHDESVVPGSVGLRSVTATRRYMLDQIRPLPSLRFDGAVGSQTNGPASTGDAITGQGK